MNPAAYSLAMLLVALFASALALASDRRRERQDARRRNRTIYPKEFTR